MVNTINNVFFIISSFLISYSEIFVCSKLYGIAINYKKHWFYISLLLMTGLGILNYFYVNDVFKMFFSIFLFFFCNCMIFRQSIKCSAICSLYSYFLITISDILDAFILIIIFGKNIQFIKDNIFGSIIGNLSISLIFILICCIPFVRKIYLKLVNITENLEFKNLIKLLILVIMSINFLLVFMYYRLESIYVVFINTVLLLIYSYIVFKILNEKSNSMAVKAQNLLLLENLHQYEDMVDRQRIDNHENKNQLLIIKNMINKNDKDLVNYINSIIDDKKEDDEVLYTRVKTIPSGGLQGIIYQKMLIMKDEKILFSLDVSRDVRKINLDNLSMDDNYKLCKIIGVFLDNAIEESNKIANKCIMISLYIDSDDLVIDISNRFTGKIDINRLDDVGYTTKGEGHGYGLSLVNDIVSNSNIFENERSVKKDIFKQVLKVKIKNT